MWTAERVGVDANDPSNDLHCDSRSNVLSLESEVAEFPTLEKSIFYRSVVGNISITKIIDIQEKQDSVSFIESYSLQLTHSKDLE